MTTHKKIGIYPGTFDPVHEGHIAFAMAAQQAHKLDEIVFLPEAQPRNKPRASNIKHRLAMLNHAISPHTGFSSLVLDEPSFTVASTLPLLQRLFPAADLTLLVGSDVATTLPYWPKVNTLLSAMHITVGLRAGDDMSELDHMFEKLSSDYHMPLAPSYITADQASLCSTDIRAGKITHSHTAIASYITSNNLYQK